VLEPRVRVLAKQLKVFLKRAQKTAESERTVEEEHQKKDAPEPSPAEV
jgi:hypothetical protein